ncbi:hypothetical protein [Allokutzneria oryzae]|uniref:DUF3558 domain-containing protein n=1 Tax=Allokutzneria oryzae TaxID=1378989 RepID=A0ABV6A1X2_9PSEU
MRTWGLVLAVAFVVLSAGCSTVVVGTAEPAGESGGGGGGAPISAISLGEIRTVDVCGLLPGEELAKIGRVEDRPGQGINVCQKVLNLEEGEGEAKKVVGVLDLKLTLESPASSPESVRRSYPTGFTESKRGATTTYQGKDATGSCMRAATVEKGLLVLSVKKRNNMVAADPCEAASSLFDGMLRALSSGGVVPRRTPDPGSLAEVDLCGLVTADMLKSAYNKDLPLSPNSGAFSCAFGESPMTGTVLVKASTMVKPGVIPPMPGTKEFDIAGRPATQHDMESGQAGGGCSVQLGHRALAADAGGGLPYLESVDFFFLAMDAGTNACQQTVALATAVAAKLPPVS